MCRIVVAVAQGLSHRPPRPSAGTFVLIAALTALYGLDSHAQLPARGGSKARRYVTEGDTLLSLVRGARTLAAAQQRTMAGLQLHTAGPAPAPCCGRTPLPDSTDKKYIITFRSSRMCNARMAKLIDRQKQRSEGCRFDSPCDGFCFGHLI